MANTIKIKNSGTAANVPSAASLEYGELALNYIDGKLYFKTGASTVDFLKSNIALGTDTTGNYMSNVAAGTGISVSHTPAEGSTATVSLASGYGDTLNPYASKTANFVLSAPNGSAGVPTFRAIVAADIPTLNQNTTGSAATVTGAAQTAITSVGTLTGLTIGGAGANRFITINAPTGYYAIQYFAINGTNKWHYEVDPAGTRWSLVESGVAERIGVTNAGATFSGTVTATTFSGALSGNVTGNVSGSAATVTGASQTAITALGTLTSLTIDGPSSPSVFFGDWNQNNNWSGIRGTHGYLLTGSSGGGDTGIFLRSESATHPVYIGSNNANTLRVDSTSATFTGNVHIPNTSANYFGSANGSNFWRPMDTANNMYFKVGTGSFYVDSPNYYFRNSLSAIIMSLASDGSTTINGALNAYSISGNSNVAGTGNASYHPSGVYSTGTNWLYGTVLTNGNNIGSTSQYVGAVYGNNWFRSSGTTGWYSESYGGGIYMIDSTWVRVYNGKRFYSDGGYSGNVNYGSYGSMSVYGATGAWEGIAFPDVATTWMSTANGQYFGVYRNNSTWNFYVVNGTFTPSDERYKRDIEPLQHGMNLIREIVPITFDPLTEDPADDPEQTVGRTHYGFTTQNILQALANVGETRDVAIVDIGGPANESNESDRQYLNHSALIAPIVKAIQELDQRLQQLETV